MNSWDEFDHLSNPNVNKIKDGRKTIFTNCKIRKIGDELSSDSSSTDSSTMGKTNKG